MGILHFHENHFQFLPNLDKERERERTSNWSKTWPNNLVLFNFVFGNLIIVIAVKTVKLIIIVEVNVVKY